MSKELSVGASKTRLFLVDRDRTIDFMGDEARVYATPSLVRDIEHACRDLIFEHLPEGEDSVGMTVTVAHLAPTLLDMEVTVVVTVTEVDGRKITFDVEARDPVDTICKGRHERFVVNVEKTRQRLLAKAAKVRDS